MVSRRNCLRVVSDVTSNDALPALLEMSRLNIGVKQNVLYVSVVLAFGVYDTSAAENHCRPKDCYDLMCYGLSNGTDGPHTIYPDTQHLASLNVSCDQETGGGGWIMYQRRVDGTLNFTKSWKDYKEGFGNNGDNTTELWLGNENVYELLQSYGGRGGKLRIEVDAFDGELGWIEAHNFTMNNEASQYRIHWDNCVASGSGMANNWNQHKGHPFKTIDKAIGAEGCLSYLKGGWWYGKGCGVVLINGEYVNSSESIVTSIYVATFKSDSLKRSRMMFRSTNDVRTCNNPCRNGAACEHVADPRGHRCMCKLEFCGPKCELSGQKCLDAGPTTPPTTLPTLLMFVVGGIMLLLILIGLGVAAFGIHKRHQTRKKEEEAARRRRSLADQLPDESFQDYMLGMFGF